MSGPTRSSRVGTGTLRREFESQVLLGASGGGSDTYTGDPISLGTTGGTITTTFRSDQPFTLSVQDAATAGGTYQTLDSKAAVLQGALYLATIVASTIQPYARTKQVNTAGSAQTINQGLRQVAQ